MGHALEDANCLQPHKDQPLLPSLLPLSLEDLPQEVARAKHLARQNLVARRQADEQRAKLLLDHSIAAKKPMQSSVGEKIPAELLDHMFVAPGDQNLKSVTYWPAAADLGRR
eukprot:4688382-Amphidinium_carterae.1